MHQRRDHRVAASRRQDVDARMAQHDRRAIGGRDAERALPQPPTMPARTPRAALARARRCDRVTATRRRGCSACACSAPARAPPASRWPATDGEHRLHVFRHHHRASREQRPGARRGEQHQARARAQAAARARFAARAGLCRAGGRAMPRAAPARSRAARARRGSPSASRCHSASVGGIATAAARSASFARRSPPARSSRSGSAIGIAELDREQEAVELRFGQRVGADLLDRVLRGDHEERLGQRARLAVHRHLALLHRLEQRALRLRRGAVDFVGEHDRVEDRARVEAERLRALVEDRHAEHVGRQQVARELDARVLEAERRRERLGERRLADAGDVLDQQVAAREQAREGRAAAARPCRRRSAASCCSDDGKPMRGGNVFAWRSGRSWAGSDDQGSRASRCSA